MLVTGMLVTGMLVTGMLVTGMLVTAVLVTGMLVTGMLVGSNDTLCQMGVPEDFGIEPPAKAYLQIAAATW